MLLAVSVFAAANSSVKTSGPHFLTWKDSQNNHYVFQLKDWWGKEAKLKTIVERNPPIRVKIEGL